MFDATLVGSAEAALGGRGLAFPLNWGRGTGNGGQFGAEEDLEVLAAQATLTRVTGMSFQTARQLVLQWVAPAQPWKANHNSSR